jgi:hypothetical protein
LPLLGGRFEFQTDSARLLRIVRRAYAGLPHQRLARDAPRLRLRLVLGTSGRARGTRSVRAEPPPVTALAGGELLCGVIERSSFVALTPHRGVGLIVVSPELLRFAYHVRYELLEFAVYVLAARAQQLVPLHGACVGRAGGGVLLVGPSGAGKSTLMLHCLLGGLDFLAEDSVLVQPAGLLATGVANYLHVRADSLRFLEGAARARLLRGAALIRRRSGVRKFEIDLRAQPHRLAAAPLAIRALVFLSAQAAPAHTLLKPLPAIAALKRLAAQQRYAATQPGWHSFRSQLSGLPAYELRRGTHPREGVQVLRELLMREGVR